MEIPAKMRAAVYRGRHRVHVEQMPVPKLEPGELLIRVRVCGVCGTDLKKIQYDLLEPPRIFGHETAGDIAAVGEGVTDWRLGERVVVHHHVPCGDCFYCKRRQYAHCEVYRRVGVTAGFEPAGGGFAEFVRVMDWIVPRGVVRIPDDVSYETASFIEPVNTVLKGLETARPEAGETALILGQGPIGLLFTQAAGLVDLTVYASDLLPDRAELSRRWGARECWDPRRSDLTKAVREATSGRGADLVIVTVPNATVIPTALECVRPGGRVLLFAQTRMQDRLPLDLGQICVQEKALLGSYSADIDLQAKAAALVFSGQMQVEPLITHRLPLMQIREALEIAGRPRQGSLKVVIRP